MVSAGSTITPSITSVERAVNVEYPPGTPLTVTGNWASPDMARAFCSMTGAAALTPSIRARAAAMESDAAITLPERGVTLMSGSMAERRSAARSVKPLNTDSTHVMAIAATAMPAIEIIEMTLTAVWLLRANR